MSGAAAPVHEKHGGLQQVFNGCRLQIDNLPRQASRKISLPPGFDVRGEVGDIGAVVIPIVGRTMLQLAQKHGAPPFGHEQKSQAGADQLTLFDEIAPCHEPEP